MSTPFYFFLRRVRAGRIECMFYKKVLDIWENMWYIIDNKGKELGKMWFIFRVDKDSDSNKVLEMSTFNLSDFRKLVDSYGPTVWEKYNFILKKVG